MPCGDTQRPMTPAARDEFRYLYQGISARRVGEILLNDGEIAGHSYWGTERVARQRGEEQNASDRVILRVELRRFASERLRADDSSIDKPSRYTLHCVRPLKYTLHANEERTRRQRSEGSWQDILRIYESVRYDSTLRITEADVMR